MYGSSDNTIPDGMRLSLYFATRYLQELELALLLIDVPCTYVRPGIGGYGLPRLFMGFTADMPEALREAGDLICALPFVSSTQRLSWVDPDPEWWFMWCGGKLTPICRVGDMTHAARIVVGQLYEEAGGKE